MLFLALFLPLLLFLGAVVRILVYKTDLHGGTILLIVLLLSTAAALLLWRAAIYLSVFSFQMTDLITM